MKAPARTASFLLAAFLMCAAQTFAQTTVNLTLGHGNAPNNPKSKAAAQFAELVKEKSGGQLAVTIEGGAKLGDDLAMIIAVSSGKLDLSVNSQGPSASLVPELSAIGLPYAFSTSAKAWEVLDGPVGQDLAKKLEGKGVILLAWMDNGIRQITNSKRPIKVPADVKGLKVRTPPDPVTVDIMQALGADAQQIKFAELYVALQQGVVDGQENPLTNIVSSKLYEVQKYLSLSGHKYEVTPFLIGKRAWERLPAADQKIFQDAAAEATQLQRKLSKEADDKLLVELKAKGVQIDSVDRAQFVAATKPVYDKWTTGPIGDFAKRVVDAAK